MIRLGCNDSLPKGWVWAKANDVMDVRDGTHDSPKAQVTGIPLVTSKNLVNGKIDYSTCTYISAEDHESISKRSAVDDGDILYAMIGTIGNPVIVKKDFDFSIKNVALFKFTKTDLSNRYIYHYLNSGLAKQQFESNSRGGTQKFVSLGNIRELMIPLPPLEEQKRIATILDKADAIRRKRQQAIDLADEFLRSVFLDMFGDPVTNPKGWEQKSLKELTLKIGSGSTPRGGKEAYLEEGISLIRSLNVHDNKFMHKDLAFISDDQANKLDNVIIEKDDLLLNITGASVCRATLVDNNILPARVNQHVCIIRARAKKVLPTFLARLITSRTYKQKLMQIATSGGATREALTKQQIESLEIVVPPLEIQEEFLSIVEKVEQLLKSSQIQSQKPFFDSLSQKAFSGEL